MTNLLANLTCSALLTGFAVGCVDSGADSVSPPDDGGLTPVELSATADLYDVVGFDGASLNIVATNDIKPFCSTSPCSVTAAGLIRPLDAAADTHLILGTLAGATSTLTIHDVWSGIRTWGDGSGELVSLSYDGTFYRMCRTYPVLSHRLEDQGIGMPDAVPMWFGGARLQAPNVSNAVDVVAMGAEEPAAVAGHCTKLAYVVTNVDGQSALADALLEQGEILVRAMPAQDANGLDFAHLGTIYVRDTLSPIRH